MHEFSRAVYRDMNTTRHGNTIGQIVPGKSIRTNRNKEKLIYLFEFSKNFKTCFLCDRSDVQAVTNVFALHCAHYSYELNGEFEDI